MSKVILLDDNFKVIGTSEKMEVHETGALHLAFSIIILNTKSEMLLQKRATNIYHTGGLWSNACCSHPTSISNLESSLNERLEYETGFSTHLKWIFSYRYIAELNNGLIENEFDHVYIGYYNGLPYPNFKEVEDWRWMSIQKLDLETKNHPDKFTPWFIKMHEILKEKGILNEIKPQF